MYDVLVRALTADAGPEGDAHGADGVVGGGGHLAGAARAVAVGVDEVVARHGVLVVVVHVVAGLRVLRTNSSLRLRHAQHTMLLH